MRSISVAFIAISLCLGGAENARSDTVTDFYKDTTISIVIGLPPGGDYDLRARLLGRHMGRHIPGTPNITPRNMPGAGGVVAANWLARLAPKDGTVMLMINQNMPLAQALRRDGVDFRAEKFGWIGNTITTPNLLTVMSTSAVKSVEDAKVREATIAATGQGTGSYYYPAAVNAVAGTKFRTVAGYSGGNAMNLAMERGEVDGRGANAWAAWKATRPQWIEQNKLIHLVQIGLKRHPELPDVPLLIELAQNDLDRRAMTMLSADTEIARAVTTTPDVPAERLEALRRAFDATMKDEAFLAEAANLNMEISPTSGEEAQAIVENIVSSPPEVVARVREIMGVPKTD